MTENLNSLASRNRIGSCLNFLQVEAEVLNILLRMNPAY
jgi:hypothetical protein